MNEIRALLEKFWICKDADKERHVYTVLELGD